MKACSTFRELDELFIDYEDNEDKFNTEYGSYNKYCPVKNGVRKCKTNYEKLSAISRHAYMELTGNAQIDLESENELSADFLVMGLCDRLYKLSKDPNLSLKDAFKKYLGNSIGSFNHHSILYNKKYFSDSNIGIMNGFYFLFKQICETVNTYNESKIESHECVYSATQCYIMYDKLYNVVSRCGPYLRLLDHLKTIYNEFIDAVIKDNNNDQTLSSKLVKLSPIDKSTFGSEFNTKGCQKLHKKLAKTTPNFIKLVNKMSEDDEKRKNGEGSQSTEDKDDEDDDDLDLYLDEEEDGFELDEEEDDFELDKEEDDELQNSPQGTPQVLPPGPPQALKLQEPAPPSQPIQSQSDSDPSTADSPPPPQNGSSSQTPQTGGSSSGNGNPGGGSSDPASSTPGGSFNLGSSLFKILLNGAEKLNKTSQFIQKNQQKVKEVTDKISGVYNDTVENIKDAYDKSSSYLSEFINNVTNQLNQVDSPSNSGGNQPGSGSPSDGGNSHNQSPSPQSPSITDPKNPASTPTKDTTSNPAPSPTTQKQSSPQAQSITPHHPQTNTSTQKTTAQINDQLLKSPNSDPISRNPWNIIPTTWNGSGDCKPKIKFINTTLVCCTSEQCNLTGISVTIVLIPIILLIVYKYLSFGSGKNSKKKKSMNRVIKLADGNRKTQIIIKSYDRNKDLKPVINSVNRKKDLLLNIYKLMQADPIPFINLFFLLIFFVYKRQLNYLEL
ncbi:PIR protein CIR protein [Plasmodium vinckei petteri]|uniref:PIR protein CIR protein n=1 Tax=Plasmodium vinckei petteri TaxID=138298 RepID=A0A6V7T9N2_PLAVN|nr:PIR protein CIR protein [Plasmodium vinckei petteri]